MEGSRSILSAYASPGNDAEPRRTIGQAADGERIGLGRIWISEKWEGKEAGAICGAASQVTQSIGIVAGLIRAAARHPLAAAGLGATMQRLSGNRFAIGLGRSSPDRLRKQGLPVFQNAHLRDYARILRQLWAGERVSYEGPLGRYEDLVLLQTPERPPQIILGATGPKTLALGGQIFDGVVLHPFLTTEGVKRSIDIVRNAAADAGRDPSQVKITACVVTAPDFLSPEDRLAILEARAVTYLRSPMLGGAITEMNGWDNAPIEALANSELRTLEPRGADADRVVKLRAEGGKSLPAEWLVEGAAVGSVENCIGRLREYAAVGADEILVHGLTTDRLGAIAAAFSPQPV